MEEKALAGDFTQGSIANKLIRFMIPILGALVLQAMYGAVDLLVVGQFGTDAGISAVSTGSNVINLVTFVISELTMGVTVLIGRYLGENRNERIGKVIGGAIVFFAIMAAVLMVLLLAFAPQFASWLNAPKEAYDLTVTYIRICGAGILFVVAYNVISGIFRGLGNSRLPLILCAIINGMGLEASSGYGIAQKVVSFIMLIPSSLMQSMSAFVAQNVGAGKEDRARKAMRTGMLLGVTIGIFVSALSFFRGDIPSALFTGNQAFIARSAEYLKGFAPEAILTCLVFSYIGYFNGHGKTIPVMVQGISASFLVRVPLSYLFSIQKGATLTTIGYAVPLASVYGIIFFTICYLVFLRKMKK